MARRRSTTRSEQDELPEDFTEHIVDIDVTQEMETSFLEYSYSVIYARALPDARDGLKPVQRRILFQMDQMGLRPDKGHVKSSRVVGDVMGRLHPHGDTAIYDTLVRLAQPWAAPHCLWWPAAASARCLLLQRRSLQQLFTHHASAVAPQSAHPSAAEATLIFIVRFDFRSF